MTTIGVSLPTDEKGLVGRECPNADCLGYFKIKFGTGLSGPNPPCHCPYCGHTAHRDHFWTQDQLRLIRSEMNRRIVAPAINEMTRRLEGSFRHSPFVRFKANRIDAPLYRYSEKTIETEITCDHCTLTYAVYGVFAFCPDCGQHNSFQMLAKNIDIVNRMLDLAAGQGNEIRSKQVENALEDCVSAFDGFGRELCRVCSAKRSDPTKLDRLSFQNLDGAKKNVLSLFGIDLAAGVTGDEWALAARAFQKRHLFAHTMGVIDAEYVERSGDPEATVGRKVSMSDGEVRRLGEVVIKLAGFLQGALETA